MWLHDELQAAKERVLPEFEGKPETEANVAAYAQRVDDETKWTVLWVKAQIAFELRHGSRMC